MAATWADYIIVAGPVGIGEQATATERCALLEAWLKATEPARLVLACWDPADEVTARSANVRALTMLKCDSEYDLIEALAGIPPDGIAYANPRYSRTVVTPSLLSVARAQRIAMPSALKLSKVTMADLAAIRSCVGGVKLWHGSSRSIRGSLAVGADVVVTTPLGALPQVWPARTVDDVQAAVDAIQQQLDAQSDHAGRVALITVMARAAL